MPSSVGVTADRARDLIGPPLSPPLLILRSETAVCSTLCVFVSVVFHRRRCSFREVHRRNGGLLNSLSVHRRRRGSFREAPCATLLLLLLLYESRLLFFTAARLEKPVAERRFAQALCLYYAWQHNETLEKCLSRYWHAKFCPILPLAPREIT